MAGFGLSCVGSVLTALSSAERTVAGVLASDVIVEIIFQAHSS